jgi:hypothetical protein
LHGVSQLPNVQQLAARQSIDQFVHPVNRLIGGVEHVEVAVRHGATVAA